MGVWTPGPGATPGDDTFTGDGADDFADGGAGHDQLYGLGGADTLIGGLGDDLLDGGAGADLLTGGGGDDAYVVGDAGDVVTEAAGGGVDLVRSSVDRYLAANIENLTLLGAANIFGVGNSLDNTIIGNAGNNSISGGVGADLMQGGAGDDRYTVDSIGDVVVEAAGQGVDLTRSAIDYTLTANVEYLTLIGAGDIYGVGNSLNNTIVGNAGNNSISGGVGADILQGGAGDDRYTVDNVGDVVIEAAGQGVDLTRSAIDYTLTVHVENLILIGGGDIDGTGHAADNLITGNGGANELSGLGGADVIEGMAGADVLYGGDGDDVLDGGTGRDVMYGEAGVDRFVFDDIADVSNDLIVGFVTGEDLVDLTGIDADITQAGDQAFSIVSAFTGHAGELRIDLAPYGVATTIYLDVDGDGVPDASFSLAAAHIFESDFFL